MTQPPAKHDPTLDVTARDDEANCIENSVDEGRCKRRVDGAVTKEHQQQQQPTFPMHFVYKMLACVMHFVLCVALFSLAISRE